MQSDYHYDLGLQPPPVQSLGDVRLPALPVCIDILSLGLHSLTWGVERDLDLTEKRRV